MKAAGLIPLLADHATHEDRATAYACKSPTPEPEELAEQLLG